MECETKRLYFQVMFLSLGTTYLWVGKPFAGGCPVHCLGLRGVPGLHPLAERCQLQWKRTHAVYLWTKLTVLIRSTWDDLEKFNWCLHIEGHYYRLSSLNTPVLAILDQEETDRITFGPHRRRVCLHLDWQDVRAKMRKSKKVFKMLRLNFWYQKISWNSILVPWKVAPLKFY